MTEGKTISWDKYGFEHEITEKDFDDIEQAIYKIHFGQNMTYEQIQQEFKNHYDFIQILMTVYNSINTKNGK